MQTEVRASNETRLPRAVRERIARIDALREPKPTGQDDATPPPADAPTPPAVTDPDPPSSTAPANDPRDSDPAYWKQRFRVTEGMLRTQRDQHAAELERRDQQITELREQLRALEEANQAAPKDLHKQFFTPEQIEQFGEEQCEAMAQAAAKAARTQAQALIDSEVKPIREREQRTAQTAAQRKAQEFKEALAAEVPDYDEVDADPDWLAWLAEDDERTGEQRQAILNRHIAAANVQRTAQMFKDFKSTRAAPPAPPVAPSRGPGGGAPDAPIANAAGKGYPTAQEIRDYSKRCATIRNPRDPRYVTDKERAEFEARLQLKRPA